MLNIFSQSKVVGQTTWYHDMIWKERAGWDTCVNIRVGCELLRMRPLRSSDRRRVSLVCRNSLKSVATKPNLRRKRFPSVSVKNFISPSAFGLWWNNYFHPDLWVALQKILHFLHPHCDPRSHDQKYPIFVSGRMGTSAQKMYPTPLVKVVMVMLKTNLVSSREIARESLQISGGHDNSLPSLPPFFSVSGSSICLWLSCVKALFLPYSQTGLFSRFLVECWRASSPCKQLLASEA